MKKNTASINILATNRKAQFNYEPIKTFEAGIVLNGMEAKAIRNGRLNIANAFGKELGGEFYLVNATIGVGGEKENVETRSRKVLLHKEEILNISQAMKQQKLTLVPMSVYTKGRLIKLELALAKPKKEFHKKDTLKARDIKRDMEREAKL